MIRVGNKYKVIRTLIKLNELTDEERLKIFGNYCTECGSRDTSCNCWRDE